jgi:hypothetical protein
VESVHAKSIGGAAGLVLRCAQRTPPLEAVTSLRLSVELVYDPGCPHVDGARDVLTRALQDAGAPAVWTEWSTADEDCPENRRGYGSPTILVNGEDVAPGPHPWNPRGDGGPCCRIYETADGTAGVPPVDQVRSAIEGALGPDVV